MMEKYKKIQDMYPREELNAFFSKEEVSKAYSEWAPSNDQIQKNVIESLFTDQTMRDFCRSLILGKVLQEVKSLPDYYSQLYDDIKNEDFKQQINELKDYYAEQQRQNEEKVKSVIAPNSNVAGLTDGKAIVEKMIEPYKGKIIYMDVWGTWCQPCVQAIKASPTLKDAVKDYDVVYLYFEYGSPESAWKSAIADLNLIKPNYVHYQLPSEQQEAVIKYLKVDGFPSYFLFDKNGNMEPLDRGHIGDTDGFKKKIEELNKK
jgi:thiol-disulfide isomerase/thioredoxin